VRLVLIVRVTDDDDFAVAGRPEDITVEVIKELRGEFLVS
jgi:hypothetical protein